MFSSLTNLRQKWALRGKYNRMQGLWTEYVKVSGLQGREEEMNNRLNAFLKAFQESDIGSEPGAMSNIVDNATEVLDALLQFASQSQTDKSGADSAAGGNEVSDTFDKALRVIEVILREDQYRTQVHGTLRMPFPSLLFEDDTRSNQSERLRVCCLTRPSSPCPRFP